MESTNDTSPLPPILEHSRNGSDRLKIQDWLKLGSNLAIPLIIGVFTIFISIHQQNVAQANRDKDTLQATELRKNDTEQARIQREEDKETARLQREEDRNLSRLQREEEQNTSRLQRKEDQENARLQRDADNETARLQRDLDLKIATDKRIQEYELAEKQRSLYQSQRSHEMEIGQQNYMSNLMLEDDRRKENILVNYQRQLTKLLLQYDSILNSSRSTFLFVLQMRTRSALRLLNPARRTIVVHTLFRAGLLDEAWPERKSPLYRVNISGVHFGLPPDHSFSKYLFVYDHLDIERADVRYASFHSVFFANQPSFAFSNLDYTDWSFAEFSHIKFTDKITMNNAIFANSFLEDITFEKISMNRVSFQHNSKCNYCKFKDTPLLGAP